MAYLNLDSRRAAQRLWRERKLLKGLCEKCSGRRRPNATTCGPCGARDSARHVAHQRAHGAQPRYADGHGYRARQREASTRWAACPAHCPRCQGFVLDCTIDIKCVNCGWRGWPAAVGGRY